MKPVCISDSVKIQATTELFNKGYIRRKSNSLPSEKYLLKLYKRLFRPRVHVDDFSTRIRKYHRDRLAIPEFNGITRIRYYTAPPKQNNSKTMCGVSEHKRNGHNKVDKSIEDSKKKKIMCQKNDRIPENHVVKDYFSALYKQDPCHKKVMPDPSCKAEEEKTKKTSKVKSNIFKSRKNRILKQPSSKDNIMAHFPKTVKLKLPSLNKETMDYIRNRQIRLENMTKNKQCIGRKRRKRRTEDPSYRFTGGAKHTSGSHVASPVETINIEPPAKSTEEPSTTASMENQRAADQFRYVLLTTYNTELNLGSKDEPIVLNDDSDDIEEICVRKSLTDNLELEDLSFEAMLDFPCKSEVEDPAVEPIDSVCKPNNPIGQLIMSGSSKKPILSVDILTPTPVSNVRYQSPDIADTPHIDTNPVRQTLASEPIEGACVKAEQSFNEETDLIVDRFTVDKGTDLSEADRPLHIECPVNKTKPNTILSPFTEICSTKLPNSKSKDKSKSKYNVKSVSSGVTNRTDKRKGKKKKVPTATLR